MFLYKIVGFWWLLFAVDDSMILYPCLGCLFVWVRSNYRNMIYSVVGLLSIACIAAVNALPCSVTFPNAASPDSVKATYDLSSLRSTSPNGWYSEDDEDLAKDNVDFYYWYNFCDNLGVRPTTAPDPVRPITITSASHHHHPTTH